MKTLTILLLVISINCMAASIEVVISGKRYDGIHRMQNGDFIAATGEVGQVIRFDSQGNQSILIDNGSYFLGVTEDSAGNIYAADTPANRIIKINTDGSQEVLTTAIPAAANIVETPTGLFHVTSFPNGGVYQMSQSGDTELLIGTAEAPQSLASVFDDEGNYYVSNSATAEIFRYTSSGEFDTFVTLPITTGAFRLGHLAFIDGYLFATGYADNRVYRVSLDGDIKVVVGPGASGDAANFQLNGPAGITAGNEPNEIYVANYNSRVINRIKLDVIDESVVPQPAGLSGLWYDPALNGEGYNVFYTASGLLFYFFGYNDQGERLWLATDVYTGELKFNQTVELPFYELKGGTFSSPASPDDNAFVWGTLKFTFNDCTQGVIELDGVDGVKTSQIQKLANVFGVFCEGIN